MYLSLCEGRPPPRLICRLPDSCLATGGHCRSEAAVIISSSSRHHLILIVIISSLHYHTYITILLLQQYQRQTHNFTALINQRLSSSQYQLLNFLFVRILSQIDWRKAKQSNIYKTSTGNLIYLGKFKLIVNQTSPVQLPQGKLGWQSGRGEHSPEDQGNRGQIARGTVLREA